jgi:hypothetical protein
VFVTDDVTAALEHIQTFYRNYHSIRYVGELLIIRLHAAPTDAELDELSTAFADICMDGGIEATDALPPEVADDDVPELPRIALQFNRMHHGRLRQLIDTLNQLASAPREPSRPPEPHEPSAAGLAAD